MATLFIALACAPAQAETVRIIAEDDWYPYSASFEEGPRGITEDLVRAAFAAEGVEVVYDVMLYDRGMALVKDGGAIGCFNAPRTKEVEEVYLWHDEPLFAATSSFYAPSMYRKRFSDVRGTYGKRVGLTQGYGYGNRIDLDTEMIKEYSRSDTILLKKLVAGRLDFIVLFDKVADYLVPELNMQRQLTRVGYADSTDIYVAFSRAHPEGRKWRDIFSRGLKKIKASGEYERILNEWDDRLKEKDSRRF